MTVFMPEPHILLTVVQGTDCGSPAPSAAWRAGAWPWPAGSTQPISTSLTSSGFEAGAVDGGLDGGAAELRRRERREGALEAADGRARRPDDDDWVFRCGCHGPSLLAFAASMEHDAVRMVNSANLRPTSSAI